MVGGCDVFFITYDEPAREALWTGLKALVPSARRVDGVKGFDAAYRRCAELSRTPRFFTIDGDNEVDPAFVSLASGFTGVAEGAVLSWSSRNSVNALAYGNGGIKNWPREQALSMRTHESARGPEGALDFCFELDYFQMPETLSTTRINSTPLQAFRAGFREGVKMSLDRGRRPRLAPGTEAEDFRRHVGRQNLDRLRIWCSVGADVPNGDWAIYGARLGCTACCFSEMDLARVSDYDWFGRYWTTQVEPSVPDGSAARLVEASENLATRLNAELGLGLARLEAAASVFFKSVYVNPRREGPMYPT